MYGWAASLYYPYCFLYGFTKRNKVGGNHCRCATVSILTVHVHLALLPYRFLESRNAK